MSNVKGAKHRPADMSWEEYFWTKVVKSDDCWAWLGGHNTRGYAIFTTAGKKSNLAHRYAYELTVGLIPAGLNALHECDNPGCVRPDHLFIGTQVENIKDMIRKGRASWQKPIDNETVNN